MTTHTDALPASARGTRSLSWTAGILPGCGVLTLADPRSETTYAVCELPTDWPGRAFRLEKLPGDPGTDPGAGDYHVFCSRDQAAQPHTCECKGQIRWGGLCKHLAGVLAVLANGWV